MAQFIYYRDHLLPEKGPFDEKTVLGLYNEAEFTSDVTFQILPSESDRAAPFVPLRDLIAKNGPSNPFRDDFADPDKRIEEAEKELAELRTVAGKRSELEEKITDIERNLEEEKKKRGMSGDDNEEDDDAYRRSIYAREEKEPLCKCPSCGLMLANWKQCVMHVNQSCPDAIARDLREKFQADYTRWEKEDADRMTMGRRLFSRMNSDETGAARPQTDFFEGVNEKLMREMTLSIEPGRRKSVEFLKSDAAKKIKTRLEKHLKEASGKLVCKQCKVACTTSIHFIIHLTTYDHRIKVRDTSLELISLLLGWFNRGLYLNKADPSEFKDVVVPVQELGSLRVTGDDVWTRTAR
ncbi:hypothetical protein PENTCL1PPCAC_26930 [Pristionchus entomophagus]|uniref:Uncharacterized protein n=1 Tax=Pristionchus entomophagus TaxID=358040 RepID=A0AAV5UCS0_9BILA|nr:hypothetical protein PENTCL1PPCAC_26930 [Pristionchus entomophagus]